MCDGGDNKLGKNTCRSYCCISGDLKVSEPSECVKRSNKEEIIAVIKKTTLERKKPIKILIEILKELDKSEDEMVVVEMKLKGSKIKEYIMV